MALSSGVKGFRSAVSREKGRPGRKHKVFMQQARKNFDVSDFIDDEYTPARMSRAWSQNDFASAPSTLRSQPSRMLTAILWSCQNQAN